MTTTLSDFLEQRAAQEAGEQQAREAKVAEWRDALSRLYAQIRSWLRASDPKGLLKVTESERQFNEEGLGRYTVPRLDISGFGRDMWVVPKARYTVATAHPPQKSAPERAAGRVDLTDDARRLVLYRFHGDPDDIWMIDDLKGSPRLFDRGEFEAALMSFLK